MSSQHSPCGAGQCRRPVLLKPSSFYGFDLYIWSLLPPKQCGHCDSPLAEEKKRNASVTT